MTSATADLRRSDAGAPPDSVITRRAQRLSRGLASLGISPGSEVVVLCCGQHGIDRSVALEALIALGARALEPSGWGRSTLAALADRRPAVQLACQEGVAAWREVGGRGIMIGDAEDALWWKALECRHAAVA